MASNPVGPVRRAWLRWKALRLPWRKRFLVGLDLQGNTYWEFKDLLSSQQGRMRRIVQYPSRVYYSEVSGKISPAWHQWLRHTREKPPSLTEQSQDLVRQSNLKILAAEADARWAAKASYLDAPGQERGQSVSSSGVNQSEGYLESGTISELDQKPGVRSAFGGGLDDKVAETEAKLGDLATDQHTSEETRPEKTAIKDDPWKKAARGPSEDWQPQAWNPGAAPKRR